MPETVGGASAATAAETAGAVSVSKVDEIDQLVDEIEPEAAMTSLVPPGTVDLEADRTNLDGDSPSEILPHNK